MHAVALEDAEIVENLRTAFEAECRTEARYTAFARQAEDAGWAGAASLFRAAALAENIHAGNHGRILHQLGGPTERRPEPVHPGSTFENLNVALAGELFEVNTMYPVFWQHARACNDRAVTRTYRWALEAEKTHARLFAEAAALLEIDARESWVTMTRDFYVCPVCGYTSEVADQATMCPICNCAWRRFEVVR